MFKLKPCPFCGADDATVAQVWSSGEAAEPMGYAGQCRNCSATFIEPSDTSEQAADMWNSRP